jgi:hypothetical protein
MAISQHMQSDSCLAEEIWLCIDLINQVIDGTLAKNSICSTKIADYQLMDFQDLLGSEDHDFPLWHQLALLLLTCGAETFPSLLAQAKGMVLSRRLTNCMAVGSKNWESLPVG